MLISTSSYESWLKESADILRPFLKSIYKIGSYQTPHFGDSSDVDLIYVLIETLPIEVMSKYRALLRLWTSEIPLDTHFILFSHISYTSDDVDAYLITSCLAWQGKCVWGDALSLEVPNEERTHIFHALKIYKSLMKSQKKETERLNKSIFFAMQVLDETIPWNEATTKTSLKKFVPPEKWDIHLAKEMCRSHLNSWKIPMDIKRKLSLFL